MLRVSRHRGATLCAGPILIPTATLGCAGSCYIYLPFFTHILEKWVNNTEVGRAGIGSRCDVGLLVLAVLNHRILLTQQVIAFHSDYELCN